MSSAHLPGDQVLLAFSDRDKFAWHSIRSFCAHCWLEDWTEAKTTRPNWGWSKRTWTWTNSTGPGRFSRSAKSKKCKYWIKHSKTYIIGHQQALDSEIHIQILPWHSNAKITKADAREEATLLPGCPIFDECIQHLQTPFRCFNGAQKIGDEKELKIGEN